MKIRVPISCFEKSSSIYKSRSLRIRDLSNGLLLLTLCLWAPIITLSHETPSPLASASDLYSELIEIIQSRGLTIDLDKATKVAALSIVQSVDPQSKFFSQESLAALNRKRSGMMMDVGIRLSMHSGLPSIYAIAPNSPAQKASLKKGDVIKGIDGNMFEQTTISQVHNLFRQAESDTIHLTVIDSVNSTNQVVLQKSLIQLPTIECAEDLPSDLCYLNLNGLFNNDIPDVLSTLRAWSESEKFGLIIDLRGANGDNMVGVEKIASLFGEPESVLFKYVGFDETEKQVFKNNLGPSQNMPTILLIDKDTAGASEVLAAVLKDSVNKTLLLGTSTAGDLLLRESIEISTNYVYLATQRLITKNGTTYTGIKGVTPDIFIPPDHEDESYEHDVEDNRREALEEELEDKRLRDRIRGDFTLRRAVDILLGLKALDLRDNKTSEANTH